MFDLGIYNPVLGNLHVVVGEERSRALQNMFGGAGAALISNMLSATCSRTRLQKSFVSGSFLKVRRRL